jgi:hypothetical protein
MRRPLLLVLFASAALVSLAAAPAPGSGAARAAEPNRQPTAEERATKDDYELDTSGTVAKLKAGESGSFSLVIKPKNGKNVHPDAPREVTIKDPKGVKPGKQKLGRGDVTDKASKAPEVKTSLTGEKAGSHVLSANVSFFLCTDAWCQRMSDRVSVTITVE